MPERPSAGAPGDRLADACPAAAVDYAALYDAHPEYAARRGADSPERRLVDLEVRAFKLPQLLAVLGDVRVQRMIEIGCATGELTAAFPLAEGDGRQDDGSWRIGIDISARNVAAAQARFPQARFIAGDFRQLALPAADLVVLSDVLEHVPDDAGFLADAARLAPSVLVNLPLECNWLNRGRAYGPDDVSGHLRAYTLAQGLDLFERAGLRVLRHRRVWVHETPLEAQRRALRHALTGQAYAGSPWGRGARRALMALATGVQPLGRALFASNLFALAERRGP